MQKTVDKNGKVKISTINTSAISDMLSRGKDEASSIIIDNQSEKEYNTLNPAENNKNW